jgi:hypothetical protein
VDSSLLTARLREEGLDPAPWSNAAGDRYPPHEHDFGKVLVCAAGSIRFGLPARGIIVDLVPGDRLDLPAGMRHDAIVGAVGVTVLEAHVPAGSVTEPRRRPAGTW